MARAAIRGHHRCMQVNTAGVTAEASPATGYPYLDAVLDQPGSVIAMAHRGGALHPDIPGAENTLHAFRHAVSLGYRYLETDVHTTSDGVLVAFHDDVPRPGHRQRRVAGRAHRGAGLAGSDRREHAVPTMVELLEEFPDCRFNIDLKSAGAVASLVALLDLTAAHDRVCVGSFSSRRIRDFRRASAGRVATSAAPSEVAAVRFRVPAPHREAAALQVPWKHKQRRLPVTTAGGRTPRPPAPGSTCTCGPATRPRNGSRSTTRRVCTRCWTWAWTE